MTIIGCYPEAEARALIAKYTDKQLEALPEDMVKRPQTVFKVVLSHEGGVEKGLLLMLENSSVKKHRHPYGVSETYSTFTLSSKSSTKRVGKSECCKPGHEHELINDSDLWAVVHYVKKGV